MGVNPDQIRLLSTLFALIFLSLPIRFISNRTLRYTYSFVVALALQIYVFRGHLLIVYVQNIIVFLILKFGPRKCGKLILYQSVIFLSGYQIYEMIYHYGIWVLDASALLMILICKYSLIGFACQDGRATDQQFQKFQTSKKYCAIRNTPSFFDYFGYLNFLPTGIIGPAIEYQDYKNFMELKQPYQAIPSPLGQIFQAFASSIVFAGLYFFSQTYFPAQALKTFNFDEKSIFQIALYSYSVGLFARFKYYFGWKLSICSVHASGISYEEKARDFSRVNSCNPAQVQFNSELKSRIANWNISVQKWLKKCVHERSRIKNSTMKQLYVFLVSSFWHGFYPGYYLTFLLWFLQLYLQGLIYKLNKKHGDPQQPIKKSFLDKISSIVTFAFYEIVFSISGVFFIMLEGQICMKILYKLYFAPFVILITGILIASGPWMRSGKKQKLKDSQEKKMQKKQ